MRKFKYLNLAASILELYIFIDIGWLFLPAAQRLGQVVLVVLLVVLGKTFVCPMQFLLTKLCRIRYFKNISFQVIF